ncbi:PREDICTED: uncharacterized protein LOC109225082 [Nicotiana attenuata]|uniref:uncharacterized protein LOC109225082 n=1 Tax=Nicotiana attenuata TaxID=49451 RepID=UPI000904EDD9|nr:PREDICTED: uncharacterized protein LOC109225082 [Nicotiana attenuata]
MLEPTKKVEYTKIVSDQGTNLGEAIQISLSLEDRQRIYEPWKFSIIIKLVGKRMLHHYLKKKIQDLWKPTEEFSLIDLGEDYYIIKFTKKENMDKAIHLGPWFINGHFLSISKWKPNFVARNEKLTSSAVWVRLPQLPTEFYDGRILAKLSNAIGRLLKIDTCTSTTLRGRYARICVEIPLEIPIQPFLFVGDHKQDILYEGEDFLCKNCDRFGHTLRQCNYIKMQNLDPHHAGQEHQQVAPQEACDSEWKTVSFNKKKNQGKKTPNQMPTIHANGNQSPGIPVKLFDAKTVPINGQEAMVILHNNEYQAQLITEGVRLAMNIYLN